MLASGLQLRGKYKAKSPYKLFLKLINKSSRADNKANHYREMWS